LKNKTQIIRYLIVGTFVVGVDLLVYYLLNNLLSYNFSKGISFTAGGVAGYFLHRGWTFEHKNASWPAAVRYTVINFLTLGFNVMSNRDMLMVWPGAVFAGWVMAAALTGVLTFVCYKWWVFKM